MEEGGAGTCPQVFVVDSQASYVHMPSKKKPRWMGIGQKFFFLVLGLVVSGLVIEGCFIYSLYKKTEAFTLHSSNTSGQQGGIIMSQRGSRDSNEIPTVPPHLDQRRQRPFAHLMGSNNPEGENSVVQWVNVGGEAITHHMGYNKGQLLVEKDGYYYLYSKVQLNAAEECLLIQHKVMKNTSAYGQSIELMKSKSFRCRSPKTSSPKTVGAEDMWSSFLAGIFHLQSGDRIFVKLDNIQKIRPGPAYNFMGAFMIFP
ncbi:tumor necrosis factor ligand superfamily member 14-like [Mastacembelus armatus]|uniref:Tumor necrosis factor ligand superfamily member 14-like n=1 Tax=Mastacembelus armatus TaxID=205130 RepID=A0A3Q3LYZ0_9TELE|nr:tumor necrosis factor ligand superfamily member 14-like [Mastacembelus armatus]XP_026158276.1 tumor necrosis factor ligand superfamily member 14-like [Mastacembelus armatus]